MIESAKEVDLRLLLLMLPLEPSQVLDGPDRSYSAFSWSG